MLRSSPFGLLHKMYETLFNKTTSSYHSIIIKANIINLLLVINKNKFASILSKVKINGRGKYV